MDESDYQPENDESESEDMSSGTEAEFFDSNRHLDNISNEKQKESVDPKNQVAPQGKSDDKKSKEKSEKFKDCTECLEFDNRSSPDLRILTVPDSSEGGEHYDKLNFCYYCHKLKSRVDQHQLAVHFDKPEVSLIIATPIGDPRRKKMFAVLRKKGDHVYNKSRYHNPDGHLIVPRRLRKKSTMKKKTNKKGKNSKDETNENDPDGENRPTNEIACPEADKSKKEENHKAMNIIRVPCPLCLGYFAPGNLHNHIRKYHPDNKLSNFGTNRSMTKIQVSQVAACHFRASEAVKNQVLSPLKFDEIGITARHDLLIILYANKNAAKFNVIEQGAYIRGHMRLLAKLLIEIKKQNSGIKDFMQAFNAVYWPVFQDAILQVCEFDSKKKFFAVPYNAETIPILIRKCFRILMNEFIVKQNDQAKKNLENFKYVFEDEVETNITSVASRSRLELNRHKQTLKLPTQNDIAILKEFIDMKRDELHKYFKTDKFEVNLKSYHLYVNLIETTALSIEIFNRRRSGETSKTCLLDYYNRKKTDTNSDFFKSLGPSEKDQRLKYDRIDIKGKREFVGQLYVCEKSIAVIETIVSMRDIFKVDSSNPYLFALASPPERPKWVDLVSAMRNYKIKCNAEYKPINYENISGTKLRKHLATYNSARNETGKKHLVVKHLGHSEVVHNKFYKQTIDGEDSYITGELEGASKFASVSFSQKRKHVSDSDSDTDVRSNKVQAKKSTVNLLKPVRGKKLN